MPTKHRRHAITETPPVREALDELRSEVGEERVNLGELVILGVRQKLAQLRLADARQAALRRSLAKRVLTGNISIDPVAADEVRRSGWARS